MLGLQTETSIPTSHWSEERMRKTATALGKANMTFLARARHCTSQKWPNMLGADQEFVQFNQLKTCSKLGCFAW